MMRFYGNGMIWDPAKNKPLIQFNRDGVYETTDLDEINKLLDRNIPHDHDPVWDATETKTEPVKTEKAPETGPSVLVDETVEKTEPDKEKPAAPRGRPKKG